MIALLRVILGVSMENMPNENKFIDFSLLLPETGVKFKFERNVVKRNGATTK